MRLMTLVVLIACVATAPVGAQQGADTPLRLAISRSPAPTLLAPQPAAPPPARSKRRRIALGALIGFGVGAVLGVTVGKEACLGSSDWQCVAAGGATGAAIGIGIAALR